MLPEDNKTFSRQVTDRQHYSTRLLKGQQVYRHRLTSHGALSLYREIPVDLTPNSSDAMVVPGEANRTLV